jgi:hypothetical protein
MALHPVHLTSFVRGQMCRCDMFVAQPSHACGSETQHTILNKVQQFGSAAMHKHMHISPDMHAFGCCCVPAALRV